MDFALSEEVELFRDSVHRWVDQECPKDWCRELERQEHVYPQELWDKLAEAGFHGVGIAEEYDGLGGDIVIQATFMREFGRNAGGLGWIWGITSFSGAKSIGFYGTEEQKRRFLPKMAAGELKTAISFTESGGGTDLLGGMKTTAEKVDGGWIINGEKTWSTTADTADYLLLIARSDKNVKRRTDGVSLFFVPREAWKDTTKTLNNERIMMSALCLGMIDGVLEDAIDYMTQRRAFGKLIGEFQTLQCYVAKIAMFQKQTELMLYNTAWLQSQGRPCAMEAAMTKTIASEYACKAADMGISILGGMGYSAETDMQRYWRDARLLRIGPVSNEMAQNMIAEGLGLPRSF